MGRRRSAFEGPPLEDDDLDDPEEHTTALEYAAYAKNVQILKTLKPDPKRDDLDKLLPHAARPGHAEVVRYLLELGARLNDKTNGGSTALGECLVGFQYETFGYRIRSGRYTPSAKAPKYAVSKTFEMLQLLLDKGALWQPDDGRELNRVRRGLYECEAEVTLELVGQLVKHRACSEDTIRQLIKTSPMKKHVLPVARKLAYMGFDIRTPEQKAEDDRQEEASRLWGLRHLASRYNRKKIYDEIWAEPMQHVAKRYNISDVRLGKICAQLHIPRPPLAATGRRKQQEKQYLPVSLFRNCSQQAKSKTITDGGTRLKSTSVRGIEGGALFSSRCFRTVLSARPFGFSRIIHPPTLLALRL